MTVSAAFSPLDDPLADDLRRHDYERYLLTLFAPAARRPALWAILALNLELARIPTLVSQPVLGQMRLAWWRDAIDKALGEGITGGNPILERLVGANRAGAIDQAALAALIDAREQDLLRSPEAPISQIEQDAGAFGGALTRLRLHALGIPLSATDAPGRHQGIAWALAGRIRVLAKEAAIGQLVVPADLASSLPLDDTADSTLLRQLAAALTATIVRHLTAARAADRGSRAGFPALADGVIVARYLHRLRRAGGDPGNPNLDLPDGLAPWALGWAWMRGRV